MAKVKEQPILPPFNIVNFAHAKAYDELGAEIQIGRLWQKQTSIFIFLRHFACIACRTHASQIWKERDKYQKSGAKINFIGNGSVDFILKFKQDLNIKDAAVFTDPTLQSFRAAGFRRGFLVSLGPTAIVNSLKLSAEGNTQGAYEKGAGDLWQLGGIVVIKPSGEIAYHYISQVLGDFPPETDVVEKAGD